MTRQGFVVIPEIAERTAERVCQQLREYELEKIRLISACMLAEMGFSL